MLATRIYRLLRWGHAYVDEGAEAISSGRSQSSKVHDIFLSRDRQGSLKKCQLPRFSTKQSIENRINRKMVWDFSQTRHGAVVNNYAGRRTRGFYTLSTGQGVSRIMPKACARRRPSVLVAVPRPMITRSACSSAAVAATTLCGSPSVT